MKKGIYEGQDGVQRKAYRVTDTHIWYCYRSEPHRPWRDLGRVPRGVVEGWFKTAKLVEEGADA